MKKFTSLFLALIIVCSLFAMAGCSDTDTSATTAKPATMTLVVGTNDPTIYVVELDGLETDKGIMPILEHLKQTKGLSYTSNHSAYGSYLTKVGDLEESMEHNRYIYLYTSVEKDRDVTEYSKIIGFEGKQLFSAGVGASELTIEDGCIIYIGAVQMDAPSTSTTTQPSSEG